MNALETALYGKLTADTGAGGLMVTATGVYHQIAPAVATVPFVVFGKQSGTHDNLTGRAHRNLLYLIKIVDSGYSSSRANTLVERINTLLGQSITVTGYTLMYLKRQSDVEYLEETSGAVYQHIGALWRWMVR